MVYSKLSSCKLLLLERLVNRIPAPPITMIVRSWRSAGLPRRGIRYLATSRDPESSRTRRARSSSPKRAPHSTSKAQNAASTIPQRSSSSSEDPPKPPASSISDTLAHIEPRQNDLLAPVHIPEDPNAVIKSNHPASQLLAQSGLVVQRQIEMLNLFIGFEQANRYVILDPQGNHVGYMAEHDGGLGKKFSRQGFKTHRAFTTHVFDRHQTEVLRV